MLKSVNPVEVLQRCTWLPFLEIVTSLEEEADASCAITCVHRPAINTKVVIQDLIVIVAICKDFEEVIRCNYGGRMRFTK